MKFFGLAVVGLIIIGTADRFLIFKPAPKYETAKVKIKNITQILEVSGETKADTQAVLKFQTGGRLAWVGVKEGDRINKWQAVASLDKSILKKQLEKYLDDYMHQRWDFDEIREKNLVTTDNYDEYSFTNTIERLIEQEQFLLNKTVSDVEIQDITNRWATLVSPIAGVVTSIDTPVAGVNVTATDAITIVDPASLYFSAEIDESDLNLVKVGQTAEIILESFPEDKLTASITSIDFNGTVSNSGSVVFTAKFALPLNAHEFRLGMTGDAAIVIAEKQNILSIPSQALIEKDDHTVVKILVDGKIQEKIITTGIENDTETEILTGLNEGEVIIVR